MSHARITKQLQNEPQSLTEQEKMRIKDNCRDGVLANGGSDILVFTGTLFFASLPVAPMMPAATITTLLGFGFVGGLAGLEYQRCVSSRSDSLLAHKNKKSDTKEPQINRPGM